MTVLTATQTQYNLLNNYTNNNSVLKFAKDGSGKWIVGLQVLDDPHFSSIHEELNKLKRIEFTPVVTDDNN
jgi:hypothetical protein